MTFRRTVWALSAAAVLAIALPGAASAQQAAPQAAQPKLSPAALLAGVLRGRLSDDRPRHVGVLLANTPVFSALFAAAARHGFVLVGLNTTRRGDALAADIAASMAQHVEPAPSVGRVA